MFWPDNQDFEMPVAQGGDDTKNPASQPRGVNNGLLGVTSTKLLTAAQEEDKPKVSVEAPPVHHFFGSLFRFRTDSLTLAEDGDFSSWGIQLQMLSDYDMMAPHVIT
ncbi:hypothetical protein C0Q70_00909 [Pomacea canaliculata]|uniref:Uncharacterized protein n=1 Tax=Pomacea canaliculata TaxID=400727 RepID=A0A2T7PY31_POMCA|nr:hypothetical protein C0Q70_00909 [Pomacea canaliculata]